MTGFQKYLLEFPSLRYGQAFFNYFGEGKEMYEWESKRAFNRVNYAVEKYQQLVAEDPYI
jgi:hypothetical protein